MRQRLYQFHYQHHLICLGWRGRRGKLPTRAIFIRHHMIPLPSWFGTLELGTMPPED